jgi:sortase A
MRARARWAAPRARCADDRGLVSVRRLLRGVSTVLIVAGVLMLVDAGLTLAWQEPVTALLAKLHQNELRKDLRRLEAAGPTALERRALSHLKTDRQRVAFLARSLRRRLKRGDAAGRIKIAKIHASFVLVKGTDTDSLKKGPGFYDNTPFPGARGTAAIAGHRTTYLAPFRHIDRLSSGDDIEIDMPYATFHYRVQRRRIVTPDSYWVVNRVSYDRLVLSACHPLYSAAKRIVVFARLVNVQQAQQTLKP